MTADLPVAPGGTAPEPFGAVVPDEADRGRQAVLTVLVAVLVAALCVVAGAWQWSRHVDRATTAERVEANFGADARPIDRVLDTAGTLPPESEWTPATVRGRYLTADGVTLRNRPVGGVPAVRLLHPMEITEGPWSGRVLIVDRGWVPTADGEERRPRATEGVVEIVARLRPAEPGDPARVVVDGERQVRSIVPESVLTVAGADGVDRALAVYGLLVTENGAPATGVSPLPTPDTSFGNNLSYAFQWWVFALGALVGAVVLVRRDRHPSAEDDQADDEVPDAQARPVGAPGAGDVRGRGARPSSRRRRRPTAEEEEDALLDAQTRTVSRGPAA